MKKVLPTLVAMAATATLAIAPSFVSSASAATTVKLTQCHKTSSSPSKIIISCADAHRWISNITWTGWGSASAHGKGTLHWDNCIPACVDGVYKTKPIMFTATMKKNNVYTELMGPAGSFGGKVTVWKLS